MSTWDQFTHFAGLDWASNHHDIVVLNRQGQIVAEFRIQHSAQGWQQARERWKDYPVLAVAVETNQGLAVQQLIEAGLAVYPVNPRSAKQYRQRQAPSGAKNDFLDAWSLADALRMDGHTWRRLATEDPMLKQLRLLCEDEIALIEQRTAFVNQLQAALRYYYPVAMEAFDDWTAPYTWDFILSFPTPQRLAEAGKRKWEKFLHAHKLARPQTYSKRLECFAQAQQWQGDSGTVAAKSLLAVSLCKMLRLLDAQLAQYRKRIEELFAQHPDHNLFGSLPGVGPTLGPRLLTQLGENRETWGSHEALQCHAGTAPICFQSGQIRKVYRRHACNKILRHTVHLWCDLSRQKCPWAAAYYQQQRARGKSHAGALRSLGQRWLKILWKMWQTRTPYDPELHLRNQQKHGSWVFGLITAQDTQSG